MNPWEKIRENKTWKRVFVAYAGTYGVCYLGRIMGIEQASFSVLGVFVMAALYFLLIQTERNVAKLQEKKDRRKRCIYAGALSYLFSVTMIMGYQLQQYGMTGGGFKGKGLILIRAACLVIAFFPFVNLLFDGLERLGAWRVKPETGETKWKSGKVFGVSAALIFLCLIPVWLAYYPIVMSYDFHRQVNEAYLGFQWFWEYQPLIHTWLIWLFLQLGFAIGNLQTGYAVMALFQMLAYTLAASYACTFLYRVLQKKWVVAAGIIFFGVLPINSVMAVCTTKDVLFSVLFLVFFLLLAERSFFAEGKKALLLDVLIVAEGCLMTMFRNNAVYAIAVYGVCRLIFSVKKEKLRILAVTVLLVLGSLGAKWGIKSALGTVIPPAKIEMYSVLIQQFARVGYYHQTDLDEETYRLLNRYVIAEQWSSYNPPIADTVKGGVGSWTFPYTWEGHEKQLFADWIKLGLKFPNEYLDAFLELTRGYWFWDDRSYAECLGYGVEGRMGLIYTYNSAEIDRKIDILHESKFPWLEKQLEKIVSGNSFYKWPVIGLLFKSAFWFWGMCLLYLACFYLKRKKQAELFLFPLLYMATMLLGPVVQFRYIFPIIVLFPAMLAMLCRNSESKH